MNPFSSGLTNICGIPSTEVKSEGKRRESQSFDEGQSTRRQNGSTDDNRALN